MVIILLSHLKHNSTSSKKEWNQNHESSPNSLRWQNVQKSMQCFFFLFFSFVGNVDIKSNTTEEDYLKHFCLFIDFIFSFFNRCLIKKWRALYTVLKAAVKHTRCSYLRIARWHVSANKTSMNPICQKNIYICKYIPKNLQYFVKLYKNGPK